LRRVILKRAIKFYLESLTINKLHSPLVYKLVRQLFDLSKAYYDDYALEQVRAKMLKSKQSISYEDLGAGSKASGSQIVTKRVSDLAKRSSSNRYKCKLIRNIVLFFQPDSMLELGTNLGMATAYMHSAAKSAKLVSIEGSSEIADLARENLQSLGYKSVEIINHSFDDFFDANPPSARQSELVYLDGNHRYESTIKYFDHVWSTHYKCIPRIFKPWQLGFFG